MHQTQQQQQRHQRQQHEAVADLFYEDRGMYRPKHLPAVKQNPLAAAEAPVAGARPTTLKDWDYMRPHNGERARQHIHAHIYRSGAQGRGNHRFTTLTAPRVNISHVWPHLVAFCLPHLLHAHMSLAVVGHVNPQEERSLLTKASWPNAGTL